MNNLSSKCVLYIRYVIYNILSKINTNLAEKYYNYTEKKEEAKYTERAYEFYEGGRKKCDIN